MGYEEPGGVESVDVREAQPEDREALITMSLRAQPESQYIRGAVERWLADPRGRLLVATRTTDVVGMVHTQVVAPTEAWIEGLRVDPAVQRQGVGRVLLSQALVATRDLGAQVARTMVATENAAVHPLLARFGFATVAEVDRYAATTAPNAVPPGEEVTLSVPGPDRLDDLWEWLVQSTLTPLNGGLEMLGWRARALGEEALSQALAAGEVLMVEEWGTIQALALLPPANTLASALAPLADETLQVRYIDGLADGLGRLALGLRAYAGARGYSSVAFWLPTLLILHDAMDGAGYTPASPPMRIAIRAL